MSSSTYTPPTIVMTGGTSGIGRRVLERLLSDRHGYRILLLARPSPQAMDLRRRFGESGRLKLMWADLADLAATREACNEITSLLHDSRIVAMVLNAGLHAVGEGQTSKDGLELAFAVNHLAHVLIVERLKSQLSVDARVIITASEVHDPDAFCLVGVTRANWQDPYELADPDVSQAHLSDMRRRGEARYSVSKLLNVMHARYLMRELPGITTAAFNPSVVPGTQIVRERVWWQRGGWKYVMPPLARIMPGMRSIEQSASDLLWLVQEAPADLVSGQYVNGRTVEDGSAESRDWSKIERTMAVSLDLLIRLGHIPAPDGVARFAEFRKSATKA